MKNDGYNPRSLRVFICHSSDDKSIVRDVSRKLRAEGIEPWLDEEDLLPGQDWNQEITQAVRSSDTVIVCLSQGSINKRGYVQKEIKYALDVADEQPDGTIFLIPVKLEECNIPERLRRWQWVNLQEQGSFEKLVRALRIRAESIGIVIVDSDRELRIGLRDKSVIVANRSANLTEREFFVYTLLAYARRECLGEDGFFQLMN